MGMILLTMIGHDGWYCIVDAAMMRGTLEENNRWSKESAQLGAA